LGSFADDGAKPLALTWHVPYTPTNTMAKYSNRQNGQRKYLLASVCSVALCIASRIFSWLYGDAPATDRGVIAIAFAAVVSTCARFFPVMMPI
jgi:hypothetical protein